MTQQTQKTSIYAVRTTSGQERTVVDLMASRPEQAFTLAELTHRLGVHKQTCHSMLVSLTDAGWLVRHPTTESAPVAVGLAAVEGR